MTAITSNASKAATHSAAMAASGAAMPEAETRLAPRPSASGTKTKTNPDNNSTIGY